MKCTLELSEESQRSRRCPNPLSPGRWLVPVCFGAQNLGKLQAICEVAEPTIRNGGHLKHQDIHLIRLWIPSHQDGVLGKGNMLKEHRLLSCGRPDCGKKRWEFIKVRDFLDCHLGSDQHTTRLCLFSLLAPCPAEWSIKNCFNLSVPRFFLQSKGLVPHSSIHYPCSQITMGLQRAWQPLWTSS